MDNECAARTGGGVRVLQWFKFEEIKAQTSSKCTCIRSVPARACACAGGRRDLQGIEGRHVFILLLLESKIPRSKPDRDHVIDIPSRR